MASNQTIDKLIVIFTFVLLVFHTFTYAQTYYSFSITLAGFCLIIVLNIIRNKGSMIINKNGSLLFMYLMILILFEVGRLMKNQDELYLIGAYLPFAIWPTLYMITAPLMTDKGKNRFVFLFLITFAISVASTLSVVITDNDAARLLAGSASNAIRYEYYKKGVGGYGFVYGSVFLVYSLILLKKQKKEKIIKMLLGILIILTSVMTVYASYTTALLILLIEIVLSFYAKSSRKGSTFIFIMFVVLIILLLNPILSFIHDAAKDLDLYWIANRIGQLINAENGGSINDLRRTQLYKVSMDSFFSNFLIGGNMIGGHSMIFDSLGEYGLVGGLFCLSVIIWTNTLRKETGERVGLIYFLFVALMMINTVDTIVLIPMVFYLLPMVLSLVNVKGGINEKNIVD